MDAGGVSRIKGHIMATVIGNCIEYRCLKCGKHRKRKMDKGMNKHRRDYSRWEADHRRCGR